jgi:hypothetical protein
MIVAALLFPANSAGAARSSTPRAHGVLRSRHVLVILAGQRCSCGRSVRADDATNASRRAAGAASPARMQPRRARSIVADVGGGSVGRRSAAPVAFA